MNNPFPLDKKSIAELIKRAKEQLPTDDENKNEKSSIGFCGCCQTISSSLVYCEICIELVCENCINNGAHKCIKDETTATRYTANPKPLEPPKCIQDDISLLSHIKILQNDELGHQNDELDHIESSQEEYCSSCGRNTILHKCEYCDSIICQRCINTETHQCTWVGRGIWAQTKSHNSTVLRPCPCCSRSNRALFQCNACDDLVCQDCLDNETHQCEPDRLHFTPKEEALLQLETSICSREVFKSQTDPPIQESIEDSTNHFIKEILADHNRMLAVAALNPYLLSNTLNKHKYQFCLAQKDGREHKLEENTNWINSHMWDWKRTQDEGME